MSRRFGQIDQNFGRHFATAGLQLQNLINHERKLLDMLGDRLNGIPQHFVISTPLNWQEQPASESAAPSCSFTTPSNGSTMQNLMTVTGLILRRPVGYTSSNSLQASGAPALSKGQDLKHQSRGSKSVPEDSGVSDLYQEFGLNQKSSPVPRSLRAGKPSGQAQSQQKAAPQSETKLKAPPTLEQRSRRSRRRHGHNYNSDCESEDESSQDSCPDRLCVEACIPVRPFCFPKLRPYAIQLSFTFTRLRGFLQNCNSHLVHHFTGQFKQEFEQYIKDAGICLPSCGLMATLPTVQTNLINGYGNRGQQLNLVGTLDFRRGRVVLGRPNIDTGSTVPQPMWGQVQQPSQQFPTYRSFGLGGSRTQFLSSFFNVTFTVDLSQLDNLASIARADRAAEAGTLSQGGNGQFCDVVNTSDNLVGGSSHGGNRRGRRSRRHRSLGLNLDEADEEAALNNLLNDF